MSDDMGYSTDLTDHMGTASEGVLGPFAVINAVIEEALNISKMESPSSVAESQISFNDQDITALSRWALGSSRIPDLVSTVWKQTENTLSGTVEAWEPSGRKFTIPFGVDLHNQ